MRMPCQNVCIWRDKLNSMNVVNVPSSLNVNSVDRCQNLVAQQPLMNSFHPLRIYCVLRADFFKMFAAPKNFCKPIVFFGCTATYYLLSALKTILCIIHLLFFS